MATRETDVAIIGGGLSGIALGSYLRMLYPDATFQIYERESSMGGTWHINQYPGCACDVPSALYSFSFAQTTSWSKTYPSAPELKTYALSVASTYKLPERTSLRTEVLNAAWDDTTSRWVVHLRDLHSNETYKHISKILFNCAGLLITPYTPSFPGRDIFTGPQMHSARWDPKLSLAGKKVAVIGNGCTASQIVPSIAPEVAHLTQFMRSAHWIQPPILIPQRKALSWIMDQFPIFRQILRFAVFIFAESDYSVQSAGWFGKFRRTMKEKWVKRYMLQKSPKKYHDLLIPDFEIGCKRRIFDSEPSYLSCLHNENVELTKDRVERITETGVVAAGREIPVDVIIYATGFATSDIIQGLKVVGRDGKDLGTKWKEDGGAGAYEQTAVSGWPNFFMVLGPNSATGHTSALMAAENTILYALRVLDPVLKGEATSVEPTEKAEISYVNSVQSALKGSVFEKGCSSWYRNKETGWNASIYPWSQITYWWRSMFVQKKDWIVKWIKPKKKKFGGMWVLAVVTALFAAFAAGNFNTLLTALKMMGLKVKKY